MLMQQEVFAMGTFSRGIKLHSPHMFPQPLRTSYLKIYDWGFLFEK